MTGGSEGIGWLGSLNNQMPSNLPAERTFTCESCLGEIKIPYDLAPTKAPCPYCGEEVLSPPVPLAQPEASGTPVLTPVGNAIPKLSPVSEPAASAPPVSKALPIAEAPPVLGESPKDELKEKKDDVLKSPVAAGERKEEIAKTKTVPAAPEPKKPEESKPISSVKEDAVSPVAVKEEADVEEVVSEKKMKGFKAPLNVNPVLFFGVSLGGVAVALLALFLFIHFSKKKEPAPITQAKPESDHVKFLREGWKGEASEVMNAFLDAETVEEKSKYVIGDESRIAEMEEFYQEYALQDQDTPLEVFNHEDLVTADKERGLFLMRFDRPGQLAMDEFFRPVASLEVQYKVEPPDAILANTATVENFAMDPMRVLAFFKHDGEALKLDWDIFVQTKHRLLKDFLATPRPGERRIFRVRMHEDVPSVSGSDPSEIRHYRLIDPAHDEDYGKVPVCLLYTSDAADE